MVPRRKRSSRAGVPRSGGVLIWKPVGITSRDAVDRAERTLRAGPLGHTGTLDPLAEGLLLLLGGEARKFQALLTDHDKSYLASVTFGVQSISDDGEGPLFCRVPRPTLPDRSRVERSLEKFRGGYDQVPPGHSAIRIDGQRAWQRVRAGETVTMPARFVAIHRCVLESFEETNEPEETAKGTIEIACGSGTYIRSLARDLGDALDCGAYLHGLARTELGGLTREQSVPLEELSSDDWLPVEKLVGGLPRIDVDPASRDRLALGQRVPFDHPSTAEGLPMPSGTESTKPIPRVIWCEDRVVGLGELRGKVIQPRRIIQPDSEASTSESS